MFGHFQKQVTAWYGRLKINAGTTKAPALEIAQTWNDAGYTSTAIKANVTDTASASGSLLMDLQVGGTSKLRVDKAGLVEAVNKISGANTVSFKATNDTHYAGFGIDGNKTGVIHFSSNSAGLSVGFAPWLGNFACNIDPTDKSANINNAGFLSFHSGYYGSGVTRLYRDADYILAQRNSTNAQESRLYGSYTSATAYQRLSTKTIREAVTAKAGASVTTTISIPKYTHLIGVTTRVTTALGATNGTTGYQVGDGTDPDLWGVITGTAQGTTSDRRDFTAVDALGPDGADRTITLTAVGGNFDGTGVIEVCAYYLAAEAD